MTTTVSQPEGLSNKTPSLRIIWDRTKIQITGEQAAKALDARRTAHHAGAGPRR